MPKDNTAPSAEDIATQMEVLRADMATLTHSVSELAKSRAGQARDAARDAAVAQGQAIANGAAQVTRQAEDAVRAQPLAATAIAAGLGFVFGYISNRR